MESGFVGPLFLYVYNSCVLREARVYTYTRRSLTTEKERMMQTFQTVSPGLLDTDQDHIVECAGDCKEVVRLGASFIWRYMGKNEFQYRAFHTQRCALECMDVEHLAKA